MDVKKLFTSGSCFFCQLKTNDAWCKDCEKDFIRNASRCPCCGQKNAEKHLCGACLNKKTFITTTEVVFSYDYPANELIKAFKFNNRHELSAVFAERLANKLKKKTEMLPSVLIPVPLHKKRQMIRGYNQSLEIARHLGKHLGIEINPSLCSRIKNTDPQSTLPVKTRRKNVQGAFAINTQRIPKHIAIIDDVITTGSTINELARLLKNAGCQRIDVWAIARA
ncbi:MAG: ComF family protein [Proteobacteria bacterium]|nr:ComF family protein [Pseudomonadota bacterium]NOG60694.1 ComF family protein [Pseudomonadota bacterium]